MSGETRGKMREKRCARRVCAKIYLREAETDVADAGFNGAAPAFDGDCVIVAGTLRNRYIAPDREAIYLLAEKNATSSISWLLATEAQKISTDYQRGKRSAGAPPAGPVWW